MKLELKEMLDTLRRVHPLIHEITNYVTANDCANITLAAGASPVMADAPEEAEEMTAISQALVLNLGTLNREKLKSMILSGKKAGKQGFRSSLIRWDAALHDFVPGRRYRSCMRFVLLWCGAICQRWEVCWECLCIPEAWMRPRNGADGRRARWQRRQHSSGIVLCLLPGKRISSVTDGRRFALTMAARPWHASPVPDACVPLSWELFAEPARHICWKQRQRP